MNRVTRTLLLLVIAVALSPSAVANDIEHGSFEEPKKVKHGAPIAPRGFTIDGAKKSVTRFVAPPPHDSALALRSGAALSTTLVVPAAPKVKKIAPEGWYGVASVDVLGRTAAGRSTLELTATLDGKEKPLASVSATVSRVAPLGSKTTTAVNVQRLWLKLPSKRLTALVGKRIELRLRAGGGGRVVLDMLRFDRFHDEPGRTLVGKPNGKNGPDLLASGALGFTGLTEHMKTAFSLLDIRKGGPAEKAGLKRSDLIVAIEGVPLAPSSLAAGVAWFERSHEAALGRAIERALAEGRRAIVLTVLRDKGLKDLTLKLDLKTGFQDTFPFEDELVARMRKDMLDWIANHQRKNGSWPGSPASNPFIAGLALLGSRDRSHRPALRKLVSWMLEKNPTAKDTKGFSYWSIAFQGMFLCEYYLASGDKRALAWIEDAIAWLPSTTHESKWGMQAFGHSPKGLPYGKKALMAPCAHLLVFEALAERCGVKSKVWKHIEPYVMHSWSDPKKGGHGGMGYNASAKDKAQFWSRTGLTALALSLRGHRRAMQKALTAIMVERHQWMLNSHAYGEPGAALGLLGLAIVQPKGFAAVMRQWRWRFLNAWQPGFGLRYSSPHMGAPYMGEEAIVNPAYALLLSIRNRGLVMAGGEPERWLAGRR